MADRMNITVDPILTNQFVEILISLKVLTLVISSEKVKHQEIGAPKVYCLFNFCDEDGGISWLQVSSFRGLNDLQLRLLGITHTTVA